GKIADFALQFRRFYRAISPILLFTIYQSAQRYTVDALPRAYLLTPGRKCFMQTFALYKLMKCKGLGAISLSFRLSLCPKV
ncbi:MAG: hypothetical protein SOZ80_08865, partial [Prevotella sp.]|uniref:hypothetical protein n=1 Tax=Prevotella sp. TaxID=59823 RepID=UPI002A804190